MFDFMVSRCDFPPDSGQEKYLLYSNFAIEKMVLIDAILHHLLWTGDNSSK